MKKSIIASFALLATHSVIAAPLEAFDMRAEALNTIGQVGNVSYVTTLHHAGVRNTTDDPQTFRVTYTICALTCDNSHWYRIKLNPHGEWQDGFTLHLAPQYGYPGTFQITAKTQVTGNGLNQETNGYANISIH